MRRFISIAGFSLLALIVALIAAMVAAPASWADGLMAQFSGGRLRLAETEGNLWRGTGKLILADPTAGAGAKGVQWLAGGVVIPGRCRWELKAMALLFGQLDAGLQIESMQQPIRLTGDRQRIMGSGGMVNLPQLQLERLGSPWNTIAPNAAIAVQWEPFQIDRGKYLGKAAVSITQVSSALSPVKPLGSYRVEIDSQGDQAKLTMLTTSGPLELEGQGEWNPRLGLRFTAYAQAKAEQERLRPLLGLLGKRDGNKTVIKLGAV
jgi:general secretion pathway protein N